MTVLRKLAWMLTRRRREAELAEELRFHLEEETAAAESAGISPAAARLAARRDLGNLTAVAEHTRAAWSWRWLEELAQDLRYAARAMAAKPAFTALAMLSLALGIGANTAIFSFMDAILLRSLPVADPQSLVLLRTHMAKQEFHGLDRHDGSYLDSSGFTHSTFAYPAFELLRGEGRLFSSVFAYQGSGPLNVSVHGQAEIATGEYVSGNYFQGLGIPPAAGRLILSDDDRAGAPPAAVVSYSFAAARFGGAAAALGQSIRVNNLPFTVIGVAPPEFFGADPGAAPDLFLPLHANLLLENNNPSRPALRRYSDPNFEWLNLMARLRPGVAVPAAEAALRPLFHNWMVTVNTKRGRGNLPTLVIQPGTAGLDSLRHQFSRPLYLLMTLVGLILALACANIANLLLARSAARRREMAVRVSIGAGRLRLVRQLLTESVLLAAAGGALGVCLAVWGVHFLTVLLSGGSSGMTFRAGLNWHVLAAAVALSILTGIVFGLAPALQATRVDLTAGLKQSRTGEPRSRGFLRLGLGRILVVSQIGIALLILVAAGLFVRTLSNLESLNLGFNRENVLVFSLDAHRAGHAQPEIVPLYERLRERFAALPGVRSAALSDMSPLGMGFSGTMASDGTEPLHATGIVTVGQDFFTAMEIPIRLGRPIDAHDRSGVAVVDERFARAIFGVANPIGRTVHLPTDEGKPAFEVVGIAGDIRYGRLKGDPMPVLYLPYAQPVFGPVSGAVFELRTAGNPLNYVHAVREIVRQADPNLPLSDVETQSALIDDTISQQITFARLSTALALLALVIAAVGLYGTVSYNVARRTSEIGLRMALGAPRRRVVWNVLREVLLLAAGGIAISLPIAYSASKLVESFLYGLKHNDRTALWFAALLLLCAALLAGYIPARRASRIDPMTALRHE
jgi:predicted permease